jgi:pimeloyl-ACP methyl ester carboxylesterase
MHPVTYDRPGWGANPADATGIFDNAAALAKLLATSPERSVVLVGNSYGAAVAIAAASREDVAVDGLILVSPAVNPEALVASDHLLAMPGVGAFGTYAGLWIYEQMMPSMGWGPRRGMSFRTEQALMLTELAEVSALLRGLNVPSVMVTGTRDWVVPYESYVALEAQLAPVRWMMVEGVGHRVVQRRPDAVIGAIELLEESAKTLSLRNN